MHTLWRPLSAAFLFGVTMLQLPTPTPTPTPEITAGQLENLVNTFVNRSLELDLQRQVFIVLVLALVALIVYQWKRPKQNNPQTTAVDAMSTVVTRQGKEIVDLQEAGREQDAKFIESLSVMSDASNRMADSVSGLDKSIDRLATYTDSMFGLIKQQSDRENARDATLQTMVEKGSEPVRQIKALAETIRDIANEIRASVTRTECKQDELMQAIKELTKARETCIEIAEETGEHPATIEPLDAEGADKPKDNAA